MDQFQREMIHAAESRSLLDDPAWKRAKAHAEAQLIAQLKSVGVKDDEMQRRLVLTLQLLGVLSQYLETEVETGQMAELQVKEPNKLKRFFTR